MLAELPARLRIELTVVNHRPMIERFPLFQQAEPGAVAMLALLIQQQTHAPGENIIFEGERNNSLYFVRSGELRVFVRSTNAPKRQAGGPNLQESFFSVARRESSRVRPLSASSSASQHRQSDSQENAACQESASESAGALGRIRQCTSAWDRIGVVRTADPAANAPDRELGPKDTTQASSSPAGSRLTRQGSATMLLRDAVKRVVAVNAVIEREKNAKEEASRKRIQEIKDASVQDIALLGNAVATLGDGDAFGEQSFLSHGAAMSTVRCIRYSDRECAQASNHPNKRLEALAAAPLGLRLCDPLCQHMVQANSSPCHLIRCNMPPVSQLWLSLMTIWQWCLSHTRRWRRALSTSRRESLPSIRSRMNA